MKKKPKQKKPTFLARRGNPGLKGWHALLLDYGKDLLGAYIVLSLTVALPVKDQVTVSAGRIIIGGEEVHFTHVRMVDGVVRHYVIQIPAGVKVNIVVHIEKD